MLRKIFWLFVFGWCCTCFFVRCYMNLTGFETARTLEKGEKRIGGSINKSYHTPRLFEIGDDSDMYILEFDDPRTVDVNATFGVADRHNLKIQGSTAGVLGLGWKYRLTEPNSIFAFSAGGGGGFSVGGPYLDFPAYFSLHPPSQDWFSLYLSPRYTMLFLSSDPNDFDSSQVNFFGANAGVMYTGGSVDFGLDFGLFNMKIIGSERHKLGNISLGLAYRFGRK